MPNLKSACLGLLLTACSSASVLEGPSPSPSGPPVVSETYSQRFVGEWVVDQPAHAGYERTAYTFGADGTLERGENEWLGGSCPFSGRECVTGFVERERDQLRCEFGARWRSEGDAVLLIDGTCPDGTLREIRLKFPTDSSTNAEPGITPVVASVAGESGWSHRQFDWRFLRCDAQGARDQACQF